MPSEVWGNSTNIKYAQDIVSDPTNKNVLKVNDVNDNNDAKIAIHAVNSSTNADARAMQVDGKTELNGETEVTGGILRVTNRNSVMITDVNHNDDQSYALVTNNSSTHPLARSIYAEGTCEFIGKVIVPNLDADAAAVEVTNNNAGANARAIKASGKSELSGVLVNNGAVDAVSGTLNVGVGQTTDECVFGNFGANSTVNGNQVKLYANQIKFDADTTLDDFHTLTVPDVHEPQSEDIKTAFSVKNTGTNALDRALKVEGVSEFAGKILGRVDVEGLVAGTPTTGLKVTNPNTSGESIALHVVKNEVGQGVNALAIKAEGKMRISGSIEALDEENHKLSIGTDDTFTRTIEIGSRGTITHIMDALYLEHAEGGIIDSTFQRDLKIGTANNLTRSVIIGNALAVENNHVVQLQTNTSVMGRLAVSSDILTGNANIAGKVDANGADAEHPQELHLGTQDITSQVVIGRNGGGNAVVNSPVFQAIGAVQVGPAGNVGLIDANGTHDLKLGTQAGTEDVVIGRSGKNVEVPAAMLDTEGELRVGPTSSSGKLDAGGSTSSPQNLLVGSQNVTGDVQLGRSGKVVDVMGYERVNSNQVILNSVASLTALASAGFVYNAVGHGNGKSIDFYIDGAMRGYIDVTGWH